MRRTLAVIALVTLGSVAFADDPKPAQAQAQEAEEARRPADCPEIVALRSPYEISRFYRAGESPGVELPPVKAGDEAAWRLAAVYRSGGVAPGGYSRFFDAGWARERRGFEARPRWAEAGAAGPVQPMACQTVRPASAKKRSE